MIALVTLLLAFPLGFLLPSRIAANVAYVAVYAWAFTFQGVYLVLSRVGGDTTAFGSYADLPISYGAVSLVIYAVGFGLVEFGHRTGTRRRSRRSVASAVG